jgi:hypothetical protein
MDAQFGLDPVKAKRIRYLGPNAKVLGDFVVGSVDQAGDRSFNDAGNYIRVVGRDTVWSHAKKLQHLAYPKASYWLDNRMFPTIEPKDVAALIGKMKSLTLEFDDVPAIVPGAESQPESRPDVPYDRVRLAPRVRRRGARRSDAPGPEGGRDRRHGVEARDAQGNPVTKRPIRMRTRPCMRRFVENIARLMLFSRFDDVAGTDPSLAQYWARPSVGHRRTGVRGRHGPYAPRRKSCASVGRSRPQRSRLALRRGER